MVKGLDASMVSELEGDLYKSPAARLQAACVSLCVVDRSIPGFINLIAFSRLTSLDNLVRPLDAASEANAANVDMVYHCSSRPI